MDGYVWNVYAVYSRPKPGAYSKCPDSLLLCGNNKDNHLLNNENRMSRYKLIDTSSENGIPLSEDHTLVILKIIFNAGKRLGEETFSEFDHKQLGKEKPKTWDEFKTEL